MSPWGNETVPPSSKPNRKRASRLEDRLRDIGAERLAIAIENEIRTCPDEKSAHAIASSLKGIFYIRRAKDDGEAENFMRYVLAAGRIGMAIADASISHPELGARRSFMAAASIPGLLDLKQKTRIASSALGRDFLCAKDLAATMSGDRYFTRMLVAEAASSGNKYLAWGVIDHFISTLTPLTEEHISRLAAGRDGLILSRLDFLRYLTTLSASMLRERRFDFSAPEQEKLNEGNALSFESFIKALPRALRSGSYTIHAVNAVYDRFMNGFST